MFGALRGWFKIKILRITNDINGTRSCWSGHDECRVRVAAYDRAVRVRPSVQRGAGVRVGPSRPFRVESDRARHGQAGRSHHLYATTRNVKLTINY